MPQGAHRSGLLKQSNKQHGTLGHRSKGAVNNANKGRVGLKNMSSSKNRFQQGRQERRNQNKQIRANKKSAILDIKRNIGAGNSAPLLVAVVPLFDDDSENVTKSLMDLVTQCDKDLKVTTSNLGNVHVAFPKFKKRFCFVFPKRKSQHAVLDAAKVCDSVTFLLTSKLEEGMDSLGEKHLSAILTQGLSASPTFLLQDSSSENPKKWNELKKNMMKSIDRKCPGTEKIFTFGKSLDAVLILRHLFSQKRKTSSLRKNRPHLIAEDVEFSGDSSLGTIKVTGYVRCSNNDLKFKVNRLVHVTGWGDFQLNQIEGPSDPNPLNERRNKEDADMGYDGILAVADQNVRESLQSENEPDAMDGEQTWPTEEELQEADMQTEKPLRTITVPKGTSSYQAAWIAAIEEEDDEHEDDDEMSNDEENLDPASQEDSDGEDEEENEEFETMTMTEGGNEDANYDEKMMNLAEEAEALRKVQQARMDAMFPDEVDTPIDQLAKVRFQKYRGLSSFRTSHWDPKENLPSDYSRIFQFENFDRTKKRVFNDLTNEQGVSSGTYVTIYIAEVPRHLYNDWKDSGDPLIVFSMLPHEQKMSVVNVAVKRHPLAMGDTIKSKERLIFHLGYRRFAACPVFSQHTSGDKHKYVRYWQPDEVIVMTMFAPIMFPPANVLVYREMSSGRHQIVGSGSLLSADPDRMVIKRTVLSGHPFKVNRKSAVVRFMFFNRSDIEWFKPVELRTKRGRRGHIREPLGTHGHMKVVFDGPVTQQDTVLMNLYKRVFPKWNYDPFVSELKPANTNSSECFVAKDVLQLNKIKKDVSDDVAME